MEEMSTLRKYRVTDLIETVKQETASLPYMFFLVPIEKTDSMMVVSVAFAGQISEKFETAQLRRQLIYPLA